MRCVTIMDPDPLTIDGSRSVANALELLFAHRKTSLTVLDAEARYIGMFGLDDFSSLLGPLIAKIKEGGD